MNNKKQLLLSIGLVLVLVLMIVGISYAAFQFVGPGSKVSTITSGIMKMSYTESDNIINLQGALPTTDETGKKRLNEGEYFDFTVSSTIQGSSNINWEIALEPTEPTAPEDMFDPDFVKVYLTELDDTGNETQVVEPKIFMNLDMNANEYTGKPATTKETKNEFSVPIFTLYSTSTNKSFSKKYRLRIWVDESYNPQGDGGNFEFGTKVNVYGKTYNTPTVAEKLLAGVGDNGAIDTTDSEQTFITGNDPNNYIWYSGKLWRAVSIDTTDNSVKLVTQWNVSTLSYNEENPDFQDSYMQQWLNDTSVDGFLGNLREPEKFIKTDSAWKATDKIVCPVGLLNINEADALSGHEVFYLSNGSYWWTLTTAPVNKDVYVIDNNGFVQFYYANNTVGVRPSVNLKSTVKVVHGLGTSEDPYRLEGDNDNPTGALLSTRYSGEYISFGTGENNLYQIVSHENGTGTKITSAFSLKDSGNYKKIAFGDNINYSKNNTIGTFLNGDYLTNGTYLTNDQVNMIEDDTTWYLGTVGDGINYKLAKYQDTISNNLTTKAVNAKIGLLRIGELGCKAKINYGDYWVLTPYDDSNLNVIYYAGTEKMNSTELHNIQPAMNLKSNVVITGGKGTKESPFTIALK